MRAKAQAVSVAAFALTTFGGAASADPVADFYKGKTMSLVFDGKGQLKETETDIAVTALPASVRDYIAKQMPGKAIKEAAIIVDAAGVKKYEAEVGGRDLLFSAEGKPIK